MVERENCEWFNSGLGEVQRRMWALERKYKATGLTIDKEIFEIKSTEYEQCCASTKQLYYTNAVLECDGKQGTMFNIINKLLHQSGSSPLPSYDSSVECFLITRSRRSILIFQFPCMNQSSMSFMSLQLKKCWRSWPINLPSPAKSTQFPLISLNNQLWP